MKSVSFAVVIIQFIGAYHNVVNLEQYDRLLPRPSFRNVICKIWNKIDCKSMKLF